MALRDKCLLKDGYIFTPVRLVYKKMENGPVVPEIILVRWSEFCYASLDPVDALLQFA